MTKRLLIVLGCFGLLLFAVISQSWATVDPHGALRRLSDFSAGLFTLVRCLKSCHTRSWGDVDDDEGVPGYVQGVRIAAIVFALISLVTLLVAAAWYRGWTVRFRRRAFVILRSTCAMFAMFFLALAIWGGWVPSYALVAGLISTGVAAITLYTPVPKSVVVPCRCMTPAVWVAQWQRYWCPRCCGYL